MPGLTSSLKTYDAYITVYRSLPSDRDDSCHAALYFTTTGSHVTYHILRNNRGDWYLADDHRHNPQLSIGHVPLGMVSLVVDELHRLMRSVPVDQTTEPGVSPSQAWIDKALVALVEEEYITEAARGRAVDNMLDIALDQERR